MEILDIIKTRRSIRHYKSDPVDEASILKVMEAAHWAPSWGNTQCWRFIVVRDSNIKSQVAETVTKVRFENDLLETAAVQAIRQAPVLIVVCAELGKAGCHSDGMPATDKGDWFMFDVALAMQNLVLAAHSLGLATVHVGRFDAKVAASILEIPQGYCVVEMTPLGYPDQVRDPRPRKELPEIVFYDKWSAE